MRAPEQLASPKALDLASLLIPIEGELLLVPNVSVSEIVPLGRVEQISDGPQWLLGNYQWRERPVPLLSFEAINGGARPAAGAQARSEEHTSELQSRGHLVCRLLLEKKKEY